MNTKTPRTNGAFSTEVESPGTSLPQNRMLKAALAYAELGLAVFLLAAGSKVPTKGSHGALDATSDPETLTRWFTEYPRANIGISSGKSGLVQIDIDPKNGGDESFRDLEAEHGPFPETPRALTPSTDGFHLYFRAPAGIPLKQISRRDGDLPILGPGIDTRTKDGGYTVAPPSKLRDGGDYVWEIGASPRDVPFAPAPQWLVEVLRDDRRDTEPRERLDVAGILAGVPEGQRDEQLHRLASKLRYADVPEDMAEKLILEAARNCSPPFPEKTALAKVANAYDRYSPGITAVTFPEHSREQNEQYEHIPLPSYPVRLLPELVRSFVTQAAAAVGVAPEMVAIPLLVNAAAAIGNRVELELKPSFRQRPILWAAVVAPPGSAKTPAAMAANAPIQVLQRDAMETWQREMVDYEAELQAWEAAPKPERGPRPDLPVLEHFLTTDATVEGLVTMLATSPGVVLQRDELVGFVASMDAYRKSGDRQHYLSAWSGSPLKVDRRTAKPLFVERPTIGVFGGVQPELIPALADEAGRRDGFLERFLWSVPAVEPARWTENEVDAATIASMAETFRALRYGAVGDGVVRLAPAAREVWIDWYDINADETANASGLVAGVNAKMPLQAARLALTLHCLADPYNVTRPLSVTTLAGAIAMAAYHKEHATRALAPLARPADTLPERVLRVIESAGDDGVSMRELYRALGGHTPADRLRAALDSLTARGKVSGTTEQSDGPGRPGETWRVVREQNEQNEHIPDAGDELPSPPPPLAEGFGGTHPGAYKDFYFAKGDAE